MRARPGSTRRGPAAAAVLVALTLTACATGASGDTATATGTSPSEATSAATSSTPDAEAGPIDGTWTTPTLGPGDFRRVLAAHGLGQHADAFLSGFGDEVALTLEVGGGFWTLSSSIDGGATAMTDRGTFEVDGSQVTVAPNSGGENTYRWKVTGDELRLDLVATTEPPYDGVPAETFQRGLYTASPFARTS